MAEVLYDIHERADNALHLAASSGGYELSFMLEIMHKEGMIKPGISTQDWVDFKQDLKDAGLKVKTEIPVDLDYKQIHATRYTYDPTNHEPAEDHLDFTDENDKHAPANTMLERIAHHAITNGQYKLAEDVLEVMHDHDEALHELDVCIDNIEQ